MTNSEEKGRRKCAWWRHGDGWDDGKNTILERERVRGTGGGEERQRERESEKKLH